MANVITAVQTDLLKNVNAEMVTVQNIVAILAIHQRIIKMAVNAMATHGAEVLAVQAVELVTIMNGVHHLVKVAIVAQAQERHGAEDLAITAALKDVMEVHAADHQAIVKHVVQVMAENGVIILVIPAMVLAVEIAGALVLVMMDVVILLNVAVNVKQVTVNAAVEHGTQVQLAYVTDLIVKNLQSIV